MRTLSLIIALLTAILSTQAQSKNTHDITVTINNALNDTGKVLFSLHSQETFMKGKGLKSEESKIKDGKAVITFTDVAPGEYAILVLHDENENYRMDFDESGMPKENYAISNNPVSYGPPQFEDGKFEVSNKDLELNLRF